MKTKKSRWWIKLEYSLFQGKDVKALQKKCGADGVLAYLKIMLRSLPNECVIGFDGYGENLIEEIASDIDADNETECVKCVIDFMRDHTMMEPINGETERYYIRQAANMSGSETADAERMRNTRQLQREASTHKDEEDDGGDDDAVGELCANNVEQRSVITERTERTGRKTDTATATAKGSASASVSVRSFEWLKEICQKEHIDAQNADIEGYRVYMDKHDWKDGDGKPVRSIPAHLRSWLKYNAGENIGVYMQKLERDDQIREAALQRQQERERDRMNMQYNMDAEYRDKVHEELGEIINGFLMGMKTFKMAVDGSGISETEMFDDNERLFSVVMRGKSNQEVGRVFCEQLLGKGMSISQIKEIVDGISMDGYLNIAVAIEHISEVEGGEEAIVDHYLELAKKRHGGMFNPEVETKNIQWLLDNDGFRVIAENCLVMKYRKEIPPTDVDKCWDMMEEWINVYKKVTGEEYEWL